MADDSDFAGASMEIFLALLALVMLLLLIGGLYLLRDRARGSSDQMSRSFLARYVPFTSLSVCIYARTFYTYSNACICARFVLLLAIQDPAG